MATHEQYNIEKFWDDEFKTLSYIQEPFNDPQDVATWIHQGYQSKICGDLCDMRHTLPSWNDKFIDYFRNLGWEDVGCAYYRMGTGTVMPVHQDRYKKYIELFKLNGREYRIRRAIVFLENWKSGHYLEIDGKPITGWRAGDVVQWTFDTPHMAANLGLDDRYTLQITGWMPSQQVLNADGNIVEYTRDEIVYSSHSASNELLSWCVEHEIDADLLWSGRDPKTNAKSHWGIKDEQQRSMFALRWA